jgi:hypothetical protein
MSAKKPAPRGSIVYALSSARPEVDIEFTVAPDGQLTVDVMTEWSLPQSRPVRLGRFAGHVTEALLERLAAVAKESAGQPAPDGWPMDTPARLVGERGEPLRPVIAASGSPEAMEGELAKAAADALASPIAAVETRAELGGRGHRSGARPAPDSGGGILVIRSIGSESIPLLVYEADTAFWARAWRNDPASPEGRVPLAYETLQALAAQHAIPTGVMRLEPGDSISIPLPEGGGVDGGFTFWRAGPGPQRRPIIGTWTVAGGAQATHLPLSPRAT